jgi:hypothetical protein
MVKIRDRILYLYNILFQSVFVKTVEYDKSIIYCLCSYNSYTKDLSRQFVLSVPFLAGAVFSYILKNLAR